jgi:5-hydroxyisourate hydrolase-like protein (transthyretin family)
MKMTKFIFYLFFALISSKAIAQNSAQTLTVYIRDSATYQPLSEALISIYNVDSMNVKPLNIVETKNKGRTQFNLSKNSNFRLCVSKKGYVNGEFLMHTNSKDSVALHFDLQASEENFSIDYFNTIVHFGRDEIETIQIQHATCFLGL